MSTVYLTTTIPYVNARPHLGHALELVQADVLARRLRQRGDDVRFGTGTDDNSLKNALAAEAAGVPVQQFVDRNAAAFEGLRDPLALSFDHFIRTSTDERHRVGVERFWRACADRGDLYRKHYEGLYCVGCEHFYNPADLPEGRCPEHEVEPQLVAEENWFFRLSRYADRLREEIVSGRLRIEPVSRRNEVLGLIASGLEDFSISRSQARARGWGIPVPDDPDQVIYVWWDALGNYITALDYATALDGGAGGTRGAEGERSTGGDAYARWWLHSDRRAHLIGKGVLRFHAVYWPAMLLSAGEPLPTEILVHDYLTIDGRKISKSAGNVVDPAGLVEQFGGDAVRWWLLREVPRVGDADFTVDRLVDRANDELANGLGNLVNRVVSMVHRYRAGRVPEPIQGEPDCSSIRPVNGRGSPQLPRQLADGNLPPGSEALIAAIERAPALADAALDDFDFRRATGAVWEIVEEANRYIEHARPWVLARADDGAAELDAVLRLLVDACATLAEQLAAFIPTVAGRIAAQCTPSGGVLPAARPLFPRLDSVSTDHPPGTDHPPRTDPAAGAGHGR